MEEIKIPIDVQKRNGLKQITKMDSNIDFSKADAEVSRIFEDG